MYMGLDIFFEKRKNYSSKIESAMAKFFNEEKEGRLETLKQAEELRAELGLEGRIKLTEESYRNNGETVTYVSARRTDMDEVGYFRKHNHLLNYFRYEENCSYLPVSRGQIEDFVEDAKKVLSHWGKDDFVDTAESFIKTTDGFFFGNTDYNQYYKMALEDDVEVFEKILSETDFNTDQIVMYCWW